MIDELESIWKEAVLVVSRNVLDVFLSGLRETGVASDIRPEHLPKGSLER
jgi:hypothetical protein